MGPALAAAVTMLMLSSPLSAGGAVHPSGVVLKAPYKATVNVPQTGTYTYGCALEKSTVPKWSGTTGIVTSSASASAHSCTRLLGYLGTASDAQTLPSITVGVPFRVGSNGNHSLALQFTVGLSTATSYTTNSCKLNVNYMPAAYHSSYGYCEDGRSTNFNIGAGMFDLDNSTWYNYTGAYVAEYNQSFWENYSYCSSPAFPTCYNSNGSFGYSANNSVNAQGLSSFTWNGVTTLTLWVNGSAMARTHHYMVVFAVGTTVEAWAAKVNVAGSWTGSASASINMGTSGNGVKLNSVIIV
jgi:hypothetical protein